MIDFTEIEKEIINAEATRDTSYATMSRLAPLYSALIYKRICAKPETIEPQPLAVDGDSEFLTAVSHKNSASVWAIMDDLMASLKVMQPRTYAAVLNKISEL